MSGNSAIGYPRATSFEFAPGGNPEVINIHGDYVVPVNVGGPGDEANMTLEPRHGRIAVYFRDEEKLLWGIHATRHGSIRIHQTQLQVIRVPWACKVVENNIRLNPYHRPNGEIGMSPLMRVPDRDTFLGLVTQIYQGNPPSIGTIFGVPTERDVRLDMG